MCVKGLLCKNRAGRWVLGPPPSQPRQNPRGSGSGVSRSCNLEKLSPRARLHLSRRASSGWLLLSHPHAQRALRPALCPGQGPVASGGECISPRRTSFTSGLPTAWELAPGLLVLTFLPPSCLYKATIHLSVMKATETDLCALGHWHRVLS